MSATKRDDNIAGLYDICRFINDMEFDKDNPAHSDEWAGIAIRDAFRSGALTSLMTFVMMIRTLGSLGVFKNDFEIQKAITFVELMVHAEIKVKK